MLPNIDPGEPAVVVTGVLQPNSALPNREREVETVLVQRAVIPLPAYRSTLLVTLHTPAQET